MAGLEIHPLSDLRDEAATLFAERYARQRVAEPLLPDVSDFSVHVPEEEGVVATRSGKPVAYLAGAVEDDMAWVRFGARDEFREEWSSLWDEGDEYPAHFVVDQDGRIGSVPLQGAFLGVLFAVIALTSDALYALLADLLAGKLRRTGTGAKLRRWVSGGIFIALGVTAATAHRVT